MRGDNKFFNTNAFMRSKDDPRTEAAETLAAAGGGVQILNGAQRHALFGRHTRRACDRRAKLRSPLREF